MWRKALGLERSHLYKKCQQLGIDLQEHTQTELRILRPARRVRNNQTACEMRPGLFGAPRTLTAAAAVIAYGAVNPRSELFGPTVHGTNSPRKLAITFDDGPNPKITPELLKLLGRYQVRATFFVIGRFARECPELVREIADRGHTVGNHTETHANLFWCRPPQIRAEIARCNEAISAATGSSAKMVPAAVWACAIRG